MHDPLNLDIEVGKSPLYDSALKIELSGVIARRRRLRRTLSSSFSTLLFVFRLDTFFLFLVFIGFYARQQKTPREARLQKSGVDGPPYFGGVHTIFGIVLLRCTVGFISSWHS